MGCDHSTDRVNRSQLVQRPEEHRRRCGGVRAAERPERVDPGHRVEAEDVAEAVS